MRSVGFFTWNSQRFSERWARRLGMAATTLAQPFAYAANPTLATRMLYTLLRGISRDRLDLLGEEYFHYVLKSRLRREAAETLKELVRSGHRIVLVGELLEHILRPAARHFGIELFISNRLEYRDGRATGRLLDPIVRPRGSSAHIAAESVALRVPREGLLIPPGSTDNLEYQKHPLQTTPRPAAATPRSVVLFGGAPPVQPLPIRDTLAHRHVLLTGVTGFVGKVWLVNLLDSAPSIGRITLLVRRTRTTSALRRFDTVVAGSPAFEPLRARHGRRFAAFLKEKVDVVEGDVSLPNLGLDDESRARLARSLDLIVNCAGLTNFNPDLRDALSSNVDSALHLVHFLRTTDHAGLIHLSTCYVVGMRDGRVTEDLQANYSPMQSPDFDAEHEVDSLRDTIRRIEASADSVALSKALRRQLLGRNARVASRSIAGLAALPTRYRARSVRTRLQRAGTRRAQHLGWPNTYTFTKSLGESLLARHGSDLPIAIIRPSIVGSSERSPFTGWNEGVNTSGPLSFLLATNFRQLPSNKQKCLDVIPVDMLCRGMTLIAVAVIARRHARVYQLATSAINPVNMGRSIELTGLAHRKHYRRTKSLNSWLKMTFEAIPVSKQRYQRLSLPMQRAVVSGINHAATSLRLRTPILARAERNLTRAEQLIKLYEPFILHNNHVFECQHVRLLSAALSSKERTLFDFAPESIDWWDYWINVHIPALRRWCYPLMDGSLCTSRQSADLAYSAHPARESVVAPAAKPPLDTSRQLDPAFPDLLDSALLSND